MFVEIGSGQSIECIKNDFGGYDVVLRTNQTEKSAYVLLARTKEIKERGDRRVWE